MHGSQLRTGAVGYGGSIDNALLGRVLLEVKHLADDTPARLGRRARHVPERDALLHGVPECEERDRREVGFADRGVEALRILDRVWSAHGGPHVFGFRVGGNARPAAWAMARTKASSARGSSRRPGPSCSGAGGGSSSEDCHSL